MRGLDFTHYRCKCGNVFPEKFGKYGCCPTAAKPITMIQNDMSKEQKQGRKGNRGHKGLAGAKRKPASEKKVNVSVYVKQADVDTLGGKAKVRTIALDAIDEKLTGE